MCGAFGSSSVFFGDDGVCSSSKTLFSGVVCNFGIGCNGLNAEPKEGRN